VITRRSSGSFISVNPTKHWGVFDEEGSIIQFSAV